MTSDQVRKLIGGYATGSLTEAERQLLFEAALEDQEVFDELAGEQALKELLEEPGAKQRLIAALEKPQPAAGAWWTRPWPWAVAGAGIAAALISMVLLRPPQKPVEIAAVPQPVPQSAPTDNEVDRVARESPKTPASSVGQRAEPAPEPQLQDARLENKVELSRVEESKDEKKLQAAEQAGQAGASAAPQQIKELLASKDSQANPAVSGAIGGVAPAAPLRLKALAPKPARFAFDYALDADRRLRITPGADGYLSVEVISGDEAELIGGIGQNGRVQAGLPVSVQVPNYANAVSIRFGASPGRKQSETLGRRDAPSGTVEDPNPSPDSQLSIQIRIQPRQ